MDYAAARARLIAQLSTEIRDKRVLEAMNRVPRERFVRPGSEAIAYHDHAIGLRYGQTISQPFIVALMTEALKLGGGEKVLEIGTGSGYQTAILAELAAEIVSVERISALATSARELLAELGYQNVSVHLTTRQLGWKEAAPYDAIIVTAGAPAVPPDLLKQLAKGGRLVVPVGERYVQRLIRVTRTPLGDRQTDLGGCAFVPLIGEQGWPD